MPQPSSSAGPSPRLDRACGTGRGRRSRRRAGASSRTPARRDSSYGALTGSASRTRSSTSISRAPRGSPRPRSARARRGRTARASRGSPTARRRRRTRRPCRPSPARCPTARPASRSSTSGRTGAVSSSSVNAMPTLTVFVISAGIAADRRAVLVEHRAPCAPTRRAR